MKQEPLIHFSIRTDAETIAMLEKLAKLEDRKLRNMANKALKVGVETISRRHDRVKR